MINFIKNKLLNMLKDSIENLVEKEVNIATSKLSTSLTEIRWDMEELSDNVLRDVTDIQDDMRNLEDLESSLTYEIEEKISFESNNIREEINNAIDDLESMKDGYYLEVKLNKE